MIRMSLKRLKAKNMRASLESEAVLRVCHLRGQNTCEISLRTIQAKTRHDYPKNSCSLVDTTTLAFRDPTCIVTEIIASIVGIVPRDPLQIKGPGFEYPLLGGSWGLSK